MKPDIKESKVEFMMRCIGDAISPQKAGSCEVIWNDYTSRVEKLKALKEETVGHILDVDYLLTDEMHDLEERGENHDHTKKNIDALELLQSCLDGTGNWADWKEYHFSQEDHHPEYWKDKTDMPLTAIMEMVADGAAAQYARGYCTDGTITTFEDQKKFYMEHKGWAEETATILAKQFMIYYNKLVVLDPYDIEF